MFKAKRLSLVCFIITLILLTGFFYLSKKRRVALTQEKLEEAREKLEKKIEELRARGIPVRQVYVNESKGALIVLLEVRCKRFYEVKEVKRNFVRPIRAMIGYEVPVLFPSLPKKRILIGNPPAPLDELEKSVEKWLSVSWKLETKLGVKEVAVDRKRGLLHVLLENLTDEVVEEIRGVVGYGIPLEVEEADYWITSLYVGKPGTKKVEELEEAREKLLEFYHNKSFGLQALDVIDEEEASFLGEEGALLSLGLKEITSDKVRIIREIVGYDIPLLITEGEVILDKGPSPIH
ncbi:MAG: hypothetical protein DRO05_06345 [Thermoproteota archaeon]|nr:MAG: hypothetical protein DRO05_06345 [Candidatus Korarchaeota archaeon]